jgi:hypothetical protein
MLLFSKHLRCYRFLFQNIKNLYRPIGKKNFWKCRHWYLNSKRRKKLYEQIGRLNMQVEFLKNYSNELVFTQKLVVIS